MACLCGGLLGFTPLAAVQSGADAKGLAGKLAPGDYVVEVVNSYPHDPAAYTQGLLYHAGHLYESTGLYGQSSLRKVDPGSGRVLAKVSLARALFAEGLALLGGRLFQLTWKEGLGFVYELETLARVGQFELPSAEGWGLTSDGLSLILSDGSQRLYFLDPVSYAVRRTLEVASDGAPVMRLNELEYAWGEILANVWLTDAIARIDPRDGRVLGWIDLKPLHAHLPLTYARVAELNGIAYDAGRDRLFVTGKLWPRLFEVRLRRRSPASVEK
ncbi:MAG: glutaminyl-peptide cyclotransferase [Gammaproteobacteria bacterium]